MAGYQLMGDPEVRCGHNLNYPLHPDSYNQVTDQQIEKAQHDLDDAMKEARSVHREHLRKVRIDE